MYEHISQVRVRYAETDQMDIVYYGNYAQYFEVGRTESIRDLGFTYKEMEAIGVRMPVVELKTRYLRPAHYDDLITIKTILKELPEGHSITFFNEVYNEKNKLLTTGEVTLYFVSIETGKRTAIPHELRSRLAVYFPENGLVL